MNDKERRALKIYATAKNLYCGYETDADPLMALYRATGASRGFGIVGRRQGSSRRQYICNICGIVVDTESSRYPMTRHASEAIDEHTATHADDPKTIFAGEFEFRRMIWTVDRSDAERYLDVRRALRWAVRYLGYPWPPDCNESMAPLQRRTSADLPRSGVKEWWPDEPSMGASDLRSAYSEGMTIIVPEEIVIPLYVFRYGDMDKPVHPRYDDRLPKGEYAIDWILSNMIRLIPVRRYPGGRFLGLHPNLIYQIHGRQMIGILAQSSEPGPPLILPGSKEWRP